MKAMIMHMCILSHKKTVFFDVRTCRRRRRGQTEGFARRSTTVLSMKLLAVTHIIAQLTKLHNLRPCYFFNVLLSVNNPRSSGKERCVFQVETFKISFNCKNDPVLVL